MKSLCTRWVSSGRQKEFSKAAGISVASRTEDSVMKLNRVLTHGLPSSSWGYPRESGVVAYFSMEIAITPAIPTYSGGLGVLAGDTLRAAADAGLPLVAVTLVHRKGYCKQRLDANGVQSEEDQPWDLEAMLNPEDPIVTVLIEERTVAIRAWRYDVAGV